jgi:nucleoporin p58/p45
MKPTTRYNDLYEEHQRAIENFDKFVLQQMAFGDECKAFLPGSGEKILELPDGVEFLKRKLNGVVDNIRSEAELVRLAKELFEGDKRNVELSHNVLAELKVPVGYRHQGIYGRQAQATTEKDEPSTDIVGFFSKTADELAETLDRNKKQLAEIELHLRGLEGQLIQAAHNLNGGASAGNSQLQEVGAVLREFEVGILGVAGAVGNAREGVNALEMGNFMQSAGRDNTGRRGVY